MVDLGKIRTLARQKGISLAVLANEVGVTEQGLYKIMRNNSTSTSTIEKIACTLDVPVAVFFGQETCAPECNNADLHTALEQLAEAQRQTADLIEIVKKLTNR